MAGSSQHLPNSAALLRSRAEERVRRAKADISGLSRDDLQAAVHELHVHQIELEMQNEQLRQTQLELEQARERYIELYDNAPVGYLTLNEKGLIIAANLTGSKQLGLPRSGLLALAFSRFVASDDQDRFFLCFRQSFASEMSTVCELRLHPEAGSTFDARLEWVRGHDEGTPVCHLTLSDISEHKRAELAERQSEGRRLQAENEERLRLALEAGHLGTLDRDLRSGKIICSERAAVILGFSLDDPLTWPDFEKRIHPEDFPALQRACDLNSLPSSSGRFEAVLRMVLPDASIRWLRLAAHTFFASAPSRKPVRRIYVLADITRQKETEAMLESRAYHLERVVSERTARLQDAVSELEHFSYTLAHDLRAPLRTMAGFSELLLAQIPELGPMHQQYLHRTRAAAERMDQLITDALNYNKLVRHEFSLAPVDCGVLLDQLLETYPQFQEARPLITLAGPFPPVLGNPALLTQCLSNLLTNALKFMPAERTPKVRVWAEERGNRVRIWVEDNGIGIADEHRDIIFKMFQRLNHAYEGTGIGLALVRKAAERMHGKVGFLSEAGHGSRFWVELDKAPS